MDIKRILFVGEGGRGMNKKGTDRFFLAHRDVLIYLLLDSGGAPVIPSGIYKVRIGTIHLQRVKAFYLLFGQGGSQ